MKKYDEDLNSTLIFVSILFTCAPVTVFIWFSWGTGRFVLPVTSAFAVTFKRASNRITRKTSYSTSSGLSPVSLSGMFQPTPVPLSLHARVTSIPLPSTSSHRLLEFGCFPCCAYPMLGWLSNTSIVTLKLRCVDPLSITAGIDNTRWTKWLHGTSTGRHEMSMTPHASSCSHRPRSSQLLHQESPPFGLLFYLIVSAPIVSYSYPSQTPFSLVLCFLIQFDRGRKKYLKGTRKG